LNASQSAPVSVVATVRADFYDPLISHHKIRALLPAQQVLLGAMSRAELESTIVEPAKLAGLTFNPARLVSNILDEAGEDEGMLPLLQYALKETWELREGNAITAESYAHSGGADPHLAASTQLDQYQQREVARTRRHRAGQSDVGGTRPTSGFAVALEISAGARARVGGRCRRHYDRGHQSFYR
jgi:hypothetical protein